MLRNLLFFLLPLFLFGMLLPLQAQAGVSVGSPVGNLQIGHGKMILWAYTPDGVETLEGEVDLKEPVALPEGTFYVEGRVYGAEMYLEQDGDLLFWSGDFGVEGEAEEGLWFWGW